MSTLLSTLTRGTRPKFWKIIPTWRRTARAWAGLACTGAPRNSTRPRVGVSSPFRQRSSVDFPAPLRPMTATISPGAMAKSTSRSAGTASPPRAAG